MAIKAKNITVGVVKPAPTDIPKVSSFKDLKEQSQKKLEDLPKQKPKKDIFKLETQTQVTKQLPKYVAHDDGELTKKINTKSQYMRDIFDLDS